MFGEEFLDPSVEIELVLRTREAVTLVGVNDVGHFTFCFAQRGYHRVSVSHRDSRIVLALTDEKGSADCIDMIKWRDFSVPVLVVIGVSRASPPARQNVRPVTGRRTKAHGFVCWPTFINATRKEIRPHFQRSQRSETSHRSSHRRDSFWICDPLIHGPTHCIKKVFHHPKPNLKIASIEELDAETGRAAVICLKNSIAAICQELHFGIVVVRIPVPRATM